MTEVAENSRLKELDSQGMAELAERLEALQIVEAETKSKVDAAISKLISLSSPIVKDLFPQASKCPKITGVKLSENEGFINVTIQTLQGENDTEALKELCESLGVKFISNWYCQPHEDINPDTNITVIEIPYNID